MGTAIGGIPPALSRDVQSGRDTLRRATAATAEAERRFLGSLSGDETATLRKALQLVAFPESDPGIGPGSPSGLGIGPGSPSGLGIDPRSRSGPGSRPARMCVDRQRVVSAIRYQVPIPRWCWPRPSSR